MVTSVGNMRRNSKRWYEANKEKALQSTRESNRRILDRIKEYVDSVKSQPCTDCGNTYPPECMDFDHLDPSTKVGSISLMRKQYKSLDKIKEEITKCELVCANCHRTRTLRRLMERQKSHTLRGAGSIPA